MVDGMGMGNMVKKWVWWVFLERSGCECVEDEGLKGDGCVRVRRMGQTSESESGVGMRGGDMK